MTFDSLGDVREGCGSQLIALAIMRIMVHILNYGSREINELVLYR